MRTIPIFEALHDCPHAPTSDPSFQESALFVWHDLEAGSGGFLRLSQEPVAGALNCCFGVFTADGLRFRSNVTGVPMAAADRGETHMGWGQAVRVDLDRLAIKADFPDCEASLVFEDFFARYDYLALVSTTMPAGHGGHHFELSGRMRGRLRIGDREIDIDALGYRDRSWGPRNWDTMRSTRWWPIVFGPDLCVHTLAALQADGSHAQLGYVMRDNIPHIMTESDLTVTLDYDAVGPRSGVTKFVLDNGERAELVHEPTDGILLHVRGYSAVESIGTVRWGDRFGMSNLEVCTNPAGGSKPPVLIFNANKDEGLTRRARQ